jgi:DNA-binding transcriptional ArsR family regulator
VVKYLDANLDNVFSALADPVRRRMAQSLASGERTMSELASPFTMTMPAILKHVGVLEKCGIVTTEKRGRVRYCRLDPAKLMDAQTWLEETGRFWNNRLQALNQFLQESEDIENQD